MEFNDDQENCGSTDWVKTSVISFICDRTVEGQVRILRSLFIYFILFLFPVFPVLFYFKRVFLYRGNQYLFHLFMIVYSLLNGELLLPVQPHLKALVWADGMSSSQC